MMQVNAFWFGFLIAIVAVMALIMITALIRANQEYSDDKMEEEEFKKTIEEMTGKKFRIVNRNGVLVGEPMNDDSETGDESETNADET